MVYRGFHRYVNKGVCPIGSYLRASRLVLSLCQLKSKLPESTSQSFVKPVRVRLVPKGTDEIIGIPTQIFDPRPETQGLDKEKERLKRKTDKGAQFAVTQPVYTSAAAEQIAEATRGVGIPVILGILPLRTPRHAEFLHERVGGISVPETVCRRMHRATDPVAEGIELSRELLLDARQGFAGACLMPPFGHYEIIGKILGE